LKLLIENFFLLQKKSERSGQGLPRQVLGHIRGDYRKARTPKSPYTEKPLYRKAHIPKSPYTQKPSINQVLGIDKEDGNNMAPPGVDKTHQ
jgi:hypothetical protein